MLHTCITASENANHKEETRNDTQEQTNRPKMPQIYKHLLDCFSSSEHQVTAGLQCHSSAQHGGFVPISSSWADEMRKMKQLSIIMEDCGLVLDRASHLKI